MCALAEELLAHNLALWLTVYLRHCGEADRQKMIGIAEILR